MLARGLGSKNREVLMVVNQLLAQIGDFKAKSYIVSKENGFSSSAKQLVQTSDTSLKESIILLLNLYMEDNEPVKQEIGSTSTLKVVLDEFKKSTRGVRALSSYLTSVVLFLANVAEIAEDN